MGSAVFDYVESIFRKVIRCLVSDMPERVSMEEKAKGDLNNRTSYSKIVKVALYTIIQQYGNGRRIA